MRVLLLSAYAATSHEYWRARLQGMFADWEWTCLTLPARHFNWRIRGNPLYWSVAQREQLSRDYDLLVATSMVDLATLRGLVPELSGVPSLVYFHENQFDYPAQQGQSASLEAQMVSVYSALAADHVVFNSNYNRDTFLLGLNRLLIKLPDFAPIEIVDLIESRASVVPVPIALESSRSGTSRWPPRGPEKRLRIVWLGRFEYDKAPERLLRLLDVLSRNQFAVHLAVVGQQFRQRPEAFDTIAKLHADSLIHMDYIDDRTDYCQLLREADVVVSTARHEFQGIAVGEAVAAGCIPIVPDRLAYTEFYASQYRYAAYEDDANRESEAAAQLVMKLAPQSQCADLPAAVEDWSEAALSPLYLQAFSKAGCTLSG
ncbi:MAG: DUF3524 domain-containing protein [Halioglobus sp.]